MGKKRKAKKSDQDSSSEEQEKKRPATVDVEESSPTLLDGDKQEEKNDEASSEIDSSSTSESILSGREGLTTVTEQDSKYDADIPEVTVVLEDIKQFEEHCRETPYDKVSVLRHGKMVKQISYLTKKVEEFVTERKTMKMRLIQLEKFITRLEKLEKDYIKVTKEQVSTNFIVEKLGKIEEVLTKLSKTQTGTNTLIGNLGEIEEVVNKMDKTQVGTNAMLEKLGKIEKVISKVEQEQVGTKRDIEKPMTFAEKLKSQGTNFAEIQAAVSPRHVIAIYPKGDSNYRSSDETKAALVNSMVPVKEKLKIRAVKKIGNNGLLIETTTKEDMTKIIQNEKLKAAGLVAGPVAKKRPQIIIYDVPKEISDNNLLSSLRRQNLEGMDKETVKDGVVILHKKVNKDSETSNYIVEAKTEIRNKLINQGRVFIGWHSLRVRDYINVSRCYKCQDYGHVSKHCRATCDICGHCGTEGHTYNTCPNKNKDPKCINCKKRGREHEHSTRSRVCPSYSIALENHISRIDYDSEIKSQEQTL